MLPLTNPMKPKIPAPPKRHPEDCSCQTCNPPVAEVAELPPKSIVFDIETIPQDEAKLLALAPVFEPDSRLKDPDKIEENIAKQRAKFIEKAALNWATAQVALIGVGDGKAYYPIYEGDETAVLKAFFEILDKSLANSVSIGGHNIKGFDFPMIINRARVLKVPLPDGLLGWWNGRPRWNDLIFDTLEIFTFGDRSRMEGCGVEDIARAYGIPGKTGFASEFPVLWKSDKANAIKYNENDIRIEIEIAKSCGYKFN
jgi:DNA polymerase elongation subunit (family B)